MKYDINYILEKYEKTIDVLGKEIKYLLYPSDSRKLLVCFTTLGPHVYERVRMLWEEEEKWEYNILFLSDNNGHQKAGLYYLGETREFEVEAQMNEIISKVIRDRKIADTVSIGSSMGGYAALYYGIKLNFLGVISVVPQINKDTIDQYGLQRWKEVSNEVGQGELPDILEMIKNKDKLPCFYIQSGQYAPDKNTMRHLHRDLLEKSVFGIFDYFEEASHTSNYMHKELIYNTFEFFIGINSRGDSKIGGVS